MLKWIDVTEYYLKIKDELNLQNIPYFCGHNQ